MLYKKTAGFSASVDLILHIEGKTVHPAQVSHDLLIFDHPPHLSPGLAQTEVVVDGVASICDIIILPHDKNATELPIAMQGRAKPKN